MATGFAQWGNDLYTGRRTYHIVQHRKRWFTIAAVMSVLAILSIVLLRFNLGIDFKGGTEFVVSGTSTSSQQVATDAVRSVLPDEEPLVSNIGDSSVRVQTSTLSQQQAEATAAALAKAYDVDASDVATSSVGPTWGKDVSNKALQGLVIFIVLVALFMAAYFRDWRMSAAGLFGLLHDLLITVGIYAAVGWEVTPATVIGFLTILGYSLYDKVVVFDKVRENTTGILLQTRATYEERANLAVNQTLVRSINTSVVALLPVAAILFVGAFLLGAGTLRDISLALFVGIAVATYSSIFLATPFEVALKDREPAIAAHTAKVEELRQQAQQSGDGSEPVLAGSGGVVVPGAHQGNRAQPRRKR